MERKRECPLVIKDSKDVTVANTHLRNVQEALRFIMLVAMNVSNRHVTVTIDVGNADSVWLP
jgi:hypothetical protein